jgi:hypothetical protein
MTVEQQQTAASFDRAADTAADPEIRQYAKNALPSLRADFDRAASLEKEFSAKPSQ